MSCCLDAAATKSQVVNWYLEEISGDIESQAGVLSRNIFSWLPNYKMGHHLNQVFRIRFILDYRIKNSQQS